VPESLFDWLAACVWRVPVTSASVIVAVVFGVGLARLDFKANTAQPIFHALNLHVFSEHSPTLRLNSLYQ
jgi:hypothetical protein